MTALLDRIAQRRALARWARLDASSAAMNIGDVGRQRARAVSLRRQLDRVIEAADRRLTEAAALPRPAGADWVWRPAPWAAPLALPGIAAVPGRADLCAGVTLYHDGPQAEVTLRQARAPRADDPAPYALVLDALAFDGSFLSLAIDMPPAAVLGLRARHVIRVSLRVTMERQVEAFARLNIRHGPNTEQMVRGLYPGATEVEFDLAHARMNERRVEALWLDLIFDAPAMNRIVIADLTLCRHPRAEL